MGGIENREIALLAGRAEFDRVGHKSQRFALKALLDLPIDRRPVDDRRRSPANQAIQERLERSKGLEIGEHASPRAAGQTGGRPKPADQTPQ